MVRPDGQGVDGFVHVLPSSQGGGGCTDVCAMVLAYNPTAAPRNASGAFSAPAAAAGGVVSVASSSSSSYRLESSASNRASSWSPLGVEPSAVLMAGGRARVHARLAMEAPEEKHIW